MKKNRGKYIFLSVIGVLCLLLILNLNKIKFMFSMLKSFNEVNSGGYEDLNDRDSLESTENPLLNIINEETADNTDDESFINMASDYNDKIELLQKDYEAKLDSLIKLGYEEYKSGDISNAKLANKYMNEGSRLEKRCDEDFNLMVKELEKELKDNGYDTSVIKDLKEYYASYKEAKLNELVEKAKEHMN